MAGLEPAFQQPSIREPMIRSNGVAPEGAHWSTPLTETGALGGRIKPGHGKEHPNQKSALSAWGIGVGRLLK
jgi:hypothetical protein